MEAQGYYIGVGRDHLFWTEDICTKLQVTPPKRVTKS